MALTKEQVYLQIRDISRGIDHTSGDGDMVYLKSTLECILASIAEGAEKELSDFLEPYIVRKLKEFERERQSHD